MNENKRKIIDIKLQKTAVALEKNNYSPFIAENKEDALEILESLIEKGASVGVGGSVTLDELGVIDFLREGDYNFLNRYDPSFSREQVVEVMKKSLTADVFITSTNAITEKGELYNVDGNANRVAAMLFGPDSVVVVAGYNKIVSDIDEAAKRVKNIVAPSNCVRLGIDNPCTKSGTCMSCNLDSKICCDTVIMGKQRVKGRVKVILVPEELGY